LRLWDDLQRGHLAARDARYLLPLTGLLVPLACVGIVATWPSRSRLWLLYAMTAIDPPQVEFMKKAGMPVSHDARITYTEVSPPHRLAYIHLADFIPGVEPYPSAQLVELFPSGGIVKMVLTIEPMHSDEWTQRAVMGWESELGKLERLLASRHS
jgi:uncharacterized protein YndB with AHSA1/START domain